VRAKVASSGSATYLAEPQRFHVPARSSTPCFELNLHVVNKLTNSTGVQKIALAKRKTEILNRFFTKVVVDPVDLLFFANFLYSTLSGRTQVPTKVFQSLGSFDGSCIPLSLTAELLRERISDYRR